MQTIVEYVKEYGNDSFKERPIGLADCLVFCQTAYFKFDRLLFSMEKNGLSPTVPLGEIIEKPEHQNLFTKDWFGRENQILFAVLSKSRRFRNCRLTCYVNEVNDALGMQFSAITFLLDDNTVFVAFRGTDESFIGWKENLEMALFSPVWAQRMAAMYLDMVADKLKARLYVGGHSKGGNLALYAALTCKPVVQKKIKKVICLDGPGLQRNLFEKYSYGKIADRVIKLVPYSTVVGMLFENRIPYRVVDCHKKGLLQHDLFNWHIRNGRLVYRKRIAPGRERKDGCINAWIRALSKEEIRLFTETAYRLALGSETKNLVDFSSNLKKSMIRVSGAFWKLDEATRRKITGILAEYFALSRKRKLEDLRGKIRKCAGYIIQLCKVKKDESSDKKSFR